MAFKNQEAFSKIHLLVHQKLNPALAFYGDLICCISISSHRNPSITLWSVQLNLHENTISFTEIFQPNSWQDQKLKNLWLKFWLDWHKLFDVDYKAFANKNDTWSHQVLLTQVKLQLTSQFTKHIFILLICHISSWSDIVNFPLQISRKILSCISPVTWFEFNMNTTISPT